MGDAVFKRLLYRVLPRLHLIIAHIRVSFKNVLRIKRVFHGILLDNPQKTDSRIIHFNICDNIGKLARFERKKLNSKL